MTAAKRGGLGKGLDTLIPASKNTKPIEKPVEKQEEKICLEKPDCRNAAFG